ncbi:uncharacterized protein LOC121348649 [Pyrgilauda ruficollis]|uniref:uncharacterized protein LOC121348649 n=1 Tax=Pyrgilauda ruficollis TaxID=221976 RepID=UPI001B876353|nr:uncharacterized protein LOC121348649 [Pyrgilauda ruficollis]
MAARKQNGRWVSMFEAKMAARSCDDWIKMAARKQDGRWVSVFEATMAARSCDEWIKMATRSCDDWIKMATRCCCPLVVKMAARFKMAAGRSQDGRPKGTRWLLLMSLISRWPPKGHRVGHIGVNQRSPRRPYWGDLVGHFGTSGVPLSAILGSPCPPSWSQSEVNLSAILEPPRQPYWGQPKVTASAILKSIKSDHVSHIGTTHRSRDNTHSAVGHFVLYQPLHIDSVSHFVFPPLARGRPRSAGGAAAGGAGPRGSPAHAASSSRGRGLR